jgi:site-specific recombinase XerD
MKDPRRTRVTGPLGAYRDGFVDELERIGYTPGSAQHQVGLMAHLSRWLESQHLEARDITPDLASEFLVARRADGHVLRISQRGLKPMLDYLRAIRVVPKSAPVLEAPLETLIEEYRRYLVTERRLSGQTVVAYLPTARLFLSRLEQQGELDLESLTAAEVRGFVTEQCRHRQTAAAKVLVVGLRSLLRFLFVAGHIPHQLASAVPTPSGFAGGTLPRALSPEAVEAMLSTCDLDSDIGRRDFAILKLLARLGLRAGEVAGLTLDDIDWRNGEITVHGKGGHRDRLPLPVDVGEALVAHVLSSNRSPSPACRTLFLRSRAPAGPLGRTGVGCMVSRAAQRAGLPRVGPHRLRHSAATAMLASGASLAEIGQALRQVRSATTAIYAKVDRVALRAIAQPWPKAAA